MERLAIRAYAKVNFSLEVLGKREDGYHDIRTVIQTISLYDQLIAIRGGGEGFVCDDPDLSGGDNLVMRARRALGDRFATEPVSLTLHKNIPYQSGMGGGSADCGAALTGLRQLLRLPISDRELFAIGKTLGADVPACMAGGAVLAQGIGERLTRLDWGGAIHLVVMKPAVSFSTAQMYRLMDSRAPAPARDLALLLAALAKGDAAGVAASLHNDFEQVASPREPVERAKAALVEAGALGALMTGSGSAVFGVFAGQGAALAAADRLLLAGWQAFPCCTLGEIGLEITP